MTTLRLKRSGSKRPGLNDAAYSLLFAIVALIIIAVRPPFEDLRDGFEFSIRVVAILVFAGFVFFEVNRYIGLFLLLALFSHFYPAYTRASYLALDSVVVFVGIYTFIVLRCSDVERIMDFICAGVLVHIVFLALQASGYDAYKLFYRVITSQIGSPTGLMANPNESSAFLALTAPMFFRKYWTWFIPLLAYGLGVSKSFNGVAALAVAIIFYGWHYGWRLIPIALALLAGVLYFIFFDRPTIGLRLDPWQKALAGYKNIWFGLGLGNWKLVYLKLVGASKFPEGYIRLHNTFIESTIEMGIAFPTLVTAYAVSLWRRFNPVALLPYVGLIIAVVLMNTNSVFKMNAINGMIIVFWVATLEVKLTE